jgi:pyruvate,water dikinase
MTTDAFRRPVAAASIDDRLERLSCVTPDDRETIRASG